MSGSKRPEAKGGKNSAGAFVREGRGAAREDEVMYPGLIYGKGAWCKGVRE